MAKIAVIPYLSQFTVNLLDFQLSACYPGIQNGGNNVPRNPMRLRPLQVKSDFGSGMAVENKYLKKKKKKFLTSLLK